MKKTVVVFYSKGYCDQVAYALEEYYNSIADQVSVLLINESQYTSIGSRKFKDGLYKFSMRNMPSVNRFCGYISYQYNEKFKNKTSKNAKETEAESKAVAVDPEKEESFKNLKTRFRKVDNIFLRFNPDVVICTTPVSLEKSLKARERLGMSMQICVAITDYCTNRGLINSGVDKFLVQNTGIKQTLTTFGIKEENIQVLGTPINTAITKKYDRAKMLEYFGVQNKELPNVMIVSGRCGCSRVIDAFKTLAPYTNDMNMFVFANDSQNIHSFIKSYIKAAKISTNVYMIDEVDDMAKIYSIIDVVVTSPTAAITYEASSRGIPVVLLKAANMLEEGNFTYLSTNGYAFIGEKTSHLVPAVMSLIKKQNPDGTALNIKPQPQDRAKEYGDYILSLVSTDAQTKKAQRAAKRAKQMAEKLEDKPVIEDKPIIEDKPVEDEKPKKKKSK